jgi:hypothetical protein
VGFIRHPFLLLLLETILRDPAAIGVRISDRMPAVKRFHDASSRTLLLSSGHSALCVCLHLLGLKDVQVGRRSIPEPYRLALGALEASAPSIACLVLYVQRAVCRPQELSLRSVTQVLMGRARVFRGWSCSSALRGGGAPCERGFRMMVE